MKKIPRKFSKIVYAGDRDIAVRVLHFIIAQGIKPAALIISDRKRATHAGKLVKLCAHLDRAYVLEGDCFRTERGIRLLKKIKPDYIICVHFPYIFPKELLEIPKRGVINLHPAYLPYNRGWHTSTWAIWEKTPYGATLHFIDEGIDTGDIIYQKQIEIRPEDTAHTVYKRVKKLELEVFKGAWLSILTGAYSRKPQSRGQGTFHSGKDIQSIQHVDINERIKAEDLIRRLRALATNNAKESAYFKVNGKLCRMKIHIAREND